MKIGQVEAIPLDIQFPQTFSFGTTDRKRSPNVILTLTTDDGLVGYGEACPVPAFTGETQESIVKIVSERVQPISVSREMPLITDLTTGAYVRSWGGRAFVGVKPPRPLSGFDLTPDPALPGWTLSQAAKRFPSLTRASMDSSVTGLYEMTPDGLPLAGPIEGAENLWVIAGFNGHGIMHGPAVAKASAEQIARGVTRTIALEQLDPGRFRNGTASTLERINLL